MSELGNYNAKTDVRRPSQGLLNFFGSHPNPSTFLASIRLAFMADTKDAPAAASEPPPAPKVDAAPASAPKAAPKQNPVFKMMGMYTRIASNEKLTNVMRRAP